MEIYLCRHGQAEAYASTDTERALTEQGRIDNLRVARQFASHKPEIDLALCSPYLRAQQTAEDLQSILGSLRFNESSTLLPDEDVRKLLSLLDDLAETSNVESVLLIGHNPLFSDLLSLLLDGEANRRQLGTSNLAALKCKYVAPGFGELQYFLTPS